MAVISNPSPFVALDSGTELFFFPGPIEFADNLYTSTGAPTLADLFAAIPSLTPANVVSAANAFASTISREDFEAAIPSPIKPAALALITPADEVKDEEGNTVTPAVEGVTFTAPEVVVPPTLEEARDAKFAALHSWWDKHPGVTVAPGITLPIGREYVSLNGVAAIIAMQTGQDCVIGLGGPSDLSVTVPAANVAVVLGTFQAMYAPISAAWDTAYRAIESATTVEQIAAVAIPSI